MADIENCNLAVRHRLFIFKIYRNYIYKSYIGNLYEKIFNRPISRFKRKHTRYFKSLLERTFPLLDSNIHCQFSRQNSCRSNCRNMFIYIFENPASSLWIIQSRLLWCKNVRWEFLSRIDWFKIPQWNFGTISLRNRMLLLYCDTGTMVN